ncbi:MAG TPA: hypothetical protein DEP65_04275 [Ruminococcus sp.]|nr:hypothetical protein [Ruminococcus sp.]
MSRQKYYAVYGDNAVGVCTSYTIAYKKRVYIKGFRCKGFDNYEEAEDYALEQASELFPYYKHIPEKLKSNYIVYANQMPDVFA